MREHGSKGGHPCSAALRLQTGTDAKPQAISTREFEAFASAAHRDLASVKNDKLIHRDVVKALNGMVEQRKTERKTIPSAILAEADRLECLLFLGYDPCFEGGEPPGL